MKITQQSSADVGGPGLPLPAEDVDLQIGSDHRGDVTLVPDEITARTWIGDVDGHVGRPCAQDAQNR